MKEFEIIYQADKVHVHRWPRDGPIWDDFIQKELDSSINKNLEKKYVIIKEDLIQIENFKFTSLRKIGITVPFFKKECTLIFEAQFTNLFAHVHVTVKSDDYVEVFNELTSWKNKFFPIDS
ncbi:MAG: hypothetical protein ACQ9CV_03925 [Nitrosopumilus sp.]